MPNTEIAQYVDDSLNALTQWKPPAAVLAEARLAAKELMEVIALKKNPVKFNGEQYLEFEDWQTCARFYGCTVKVESVTFTEYAGVKGFEAVAVVLDRNQAEISRAESMCLNDEENWGMRKKYEYRDVLDADGKKIWEKVKFKDGNEKNMPKREKVEVESVPTPLFQLKSMAQTRACAKALRQVFAWVVVLAGYKPSVAEEMNPSDRDEDRGEQQDSRPAPNAQRKSQKQQQAPQQEDTICAECRGPNGNHTAECQSGKGAPATKKDGSPKKTPEELDEIWNKHEGHDVEKHINRGQGITFIRIATACGLNDEAQKLVIKNICGENVTSRNHIPKDKFDELLDSVDSEFKHHPRPEPF